YHFFVRRTSIQPLSSFSRISGQEGNAPLCTGVPPFTASFSSPAGDVLNPNPAAQAVAAPTSSLRDTFCLIEPSLRGHEPSERSSLPHSPKMDPVVRNRSLLLRLHTLLLSKRVAKVHRQRHRCNSRQPRAFPVRALA